MTDTTVSTIERIRELNDDFRRTFVGGAVMITAGVEAMPNEQRRSLLAKVRAFDSFTEDTDPHGEHDFGAVDEGEVRCFWKIDYYDREMTMHSGDAADPAVTTRVLTVMLADEYCSRASNPKSLPGSGGLGATRSSGSNASPAFVRRSTTRMATRTRRCPSSDQERRRVPVDAPLSSPTT